MRGRGVGGRACAPDAVPSMASARHPMEAEVGLRMMYLDHSRQIQRPDRAPGGGPASSAGTATSRADTPTTSLSPPQPIYAHRRSTPRLTPLLAQSPDSSGASLSAAPVPAPGWLDVPATAPREPLLAVSMRGESASGSAPRAPAHGITILIVENEESNRTLIEKILGFAGYRCVVACNGQEAVEVFGRVRPDLILTDISMPVMDGYEATAAIRARPDGATVPIVAVTAHAMAGDRERAIEQGCTEYLAKPYRTRELLDVVERLLNKGSI